VAACLCIFHRHCARSLYLGCFSHEKKKRAWCQLECGGTVHGAGVCAWHTQCMAQESCMKRLKSELCRRKKKLQRKGACLQEHECAHAGNWEFHGQTSYTRENQVGPGVESIMQGGCVVWLLASGPFEKVFFYERNMNRGM
jgi:hypothetical protein